LGVKNDGTPGDKNLAGGKHPGVMHHELEDNLPDMPLYNWQINYMPDWGAFFWYQLDHIWLKIDDTVKATPRNAEGDYTDPCYEVDLFSGAMSHDRVEVTGDNSLAADKKGHLRSLSRADGVLCFIIYSTASSTTKPWR